MYLEEYSCFGIWPFRIPRNVVAGRTAGGGGLFDPLLDYWGRGGGRFQQLREPKLEP